MKLIIDIDEKLYNAIKGQAKEGIANRLKICIANGIPYEERPQGEWIPVSERLPEEKMFNPSGSDFGFDFEEVVCTTIWGNVTHYKFGKTIGHNRPHFWLGGGIMDEYVVAWQPLPKPYMREADNEL